MPAKGPEMQEEGVPAKGPDDESAKGPGISRKEGKHDESKNVMGMEYDEEVFPITIDSGAVDTVGPKKVGEGFPISPTRDSAMGIGYRADNGTHIKNHGERVIEGLTERDSNSK